MVRRAALLFAGLSVLLAACAGGPRRAVVRAVEQREVRDALAAYERYRKLDGPDGDLLAHVAALVLEEAALSGDETQARAAILQRRMAGTAGEPVLERVADRAEDDAVRAAALEALASRGDTSAEAYLYAMIDSDDPRVLAHAVSAMDAEDEAPRLLELLRHPAEAVRKAAEMGIQLNKTDLIGDIGMFEEIATLAANDDELTDFELELIAAGVPPECVETEA